MDAGGSTGFGPAPAEHPQGAAERRRAGRHEGRQQEERPRWLQRGLLTAAIACFALPFLTVTCYGENTVSGVQVATKTDLYGSDRPGEGQLVSEEPANAFAFLALVVGVVALATAFLRSRPASAWAAATGVIALQGLFVYAFHRSWGEAWPRIGFVGATMLLLGAAWLGAKVLPGWIVPTIAVITAAMLPGALVGIDALEGELSWLSLPIYGGGVVAVALAVGAYPAAVGDRSTIGGRATPMRIALAATVSLVILVAAAIGAPLLMYVVESDGGEPPSVGGAYAFAIAVLAILVAASVVAWLSARAIVRR
jgi:hypothetical protein